MRLKKIEITGFKSFADRTVLRFDQGITGIVGPNGCGKSNVADAFRWVLGEQSAKSIRGGKMHDVIFSGTASRKPLGFAEVTITLTDVGDALPVEYEEVAVTRRLHRSGESEYLLNGQPVRLKDVHSLFLDSGVGKNTFAIFEQGKVEQVINYSPIERRKIFEDASGILRFLQRKREALRKLEQTEGNMARVGDIHSEVQKQIAVLERQAEDARLYKQNKLELEETEKSVSVARWDSLNKEITKTEKLVKDLEKECVENQEEANQLRENLQKGRQVFAEDEKALKKLERTVYELRTQQEVHAQKHATQKQRLGEVQEKKKQYEEESKQLKQREKEELQRKKEVEQKLDQLTKRVESENVNLRRDEEQESLSEEAVKDLRARQHHLQKQRLSVVQSEHKIVTELREQKIRQESNEERLAALEENYKTLHAKKEEGVKELAACKKELAESITQLENKKEKIEKAQQQHQKLCEVLKNSEEEQTVLLRVVAETQARQKILLKMREELEGLSVGSQVLVKAEALAGKVQPLFTACGDAAKDPAVAASLRPYSETLLVKSKKDLQELIQFATSNRVADFSVLCEELLPHGESLIARLFGQRKRVEVIGDLIKGFLPGEGICAADGSLIDDRGVLFVFGEGTGTTFAREAELVELEKHVAEHQKSLDASEKQLEEFEKKVAESKEMLTQLDRDQRTAEMQMLEMRVRAETSESRLKEGEKALESVAKERQERQQASVAIAKELERLVEEQKTAHQKAEQAEKESSAIDGELQKREKELQGKQEAFEKKRTAHQQLIEEQNGLLREKEVLSVKLEENCKRQQHLAEESDKNHTFQKALLEERGQDKGALEEIAIARKNAEEELKQGQCAAADQKKQLAQIDRQVATLLEQQRKLEKGQVQLVAQLENKRHILSGIAKELLDRYHLSIEEARRQSDPLEISIEEAEKAIKLLRKAIEDAGDVNMTSIDEYEKYKLRDDFLTKQLDDLGGSCDELQGHIGDLDGESRKIFTTVFGQIRANFQKNFQVLFQGGEADLQFTEHNDILEAGIEIVAKPPGKQMRSISLLSGGEKCLTAVALLFAIFEVRTAPFCILDEIDAPLDDANIDRFLNVVRQFIDQCQFIIITHNKRTMAIADQIFGVSMQEKGVSKLLSMQFNRENSVANLEPQGEAVQV